MEKKLELLRSLIEELESQGHTKEAIRNAAQSLREHYETVERLKKGESEC
jgi:hypothetical protein